MIRKTQLRAAVIVASSSLMLSACVDQESDVAGQQENTTRESALLSVFSVGPSSQTINEGGTATVGVSLLCSNNLTQDVIITANWGDGTTPEARTIEFGNFGTQGACLAGYVEVCGASSTDADCANWTHTYADGIDPTTGTVYPISFTDVQGVDSGGQAVSVNVRNLAPVVSLSRTGADFEGVSADFDLTAEDPGLLATEIAGVTWTWTPAGNVNDPTVVTCTCANVTDCDDGSNLSICNETDEPETDTKLRRYLDDGAYTLTVVVTDKDGGQTTVSKNTTISNLPPENLTVKINNNLISTDSMTPTVLTEGTSYAFLGSLQEPGIDTLDLDWNLGDGTLRPTATGAVTKASWPNLTNLSQDALEFNYTYDNTAAALSNNYTVIFTADDDDAGTGTRTGFVRVVDVDPVINSFTANGTSGAVSVIEGATVTFAVSAVSGAQDPTFDALTTYDWDIDGNGNGNLTNEYTVVGCGTADTTCAVTFLDDDPAGSYDIDVTVNDEDSSTTSATRTVTVTNQAPNLAAIPALAGILEAGSSSLTYTFTDPAGTLDGPYSVTVDWNDGSTPSTATHVAPGAFTIGPHTYADNSLCTNPSAGVCTISVTVCEDFGMMNPFAAGPPLKCDTETTTIVVTNVVPTPSIVAFPPLEEGYTFNLDGGFSDPAGALDDTYSGEWSGLDFGDQTLPATYTARLSALDVTDGGRFDSQGPKVIQLTVTDGDGGVSLPASASVTVADNTPIITSVVQNFVPVMDNLEPAQATLDITVKAETASDLLEKVVVNWGDSNIADSEITMGVAGIGTAGNTISVTAPGDYIESGVYTATITVFDEDSSASTTKTITVLNVAPTITLVEATPAAPVIVTEGQSFSARITATDPSTVDAQTLTFQSNWGDTTSDFATGSVTAPGTARAQFSHVYTNPGTYTVTLTVTDPDGGSDTSTLTIEVLNRAPTITDVFNTGPVNENTSVTAVMLVNNPGADTLSYSFNFACTKTSSALVNDSDFTEAIPGMGTSAVRSNTYPNQGSNPVCVRVCDDDGPAFGCDYGLTTVVVNNVAPTISSFPAPAAVNENSAGANVVLSATATDPGPNDTLTYAFDCTSDGSDDFTNTTGTATCVYTGSGTFTASVRVTDGDGGSTFATTQVRVTNLAPAITNVVGLDVNEGDTTTVTITASDIGGGALTYRFDFDNDGTYDVQKATNAANWTYTTDGVKTVAVEVCDSNNACDQDSTTLTVSNVAPLIADVSGLDINEGGTTTVTIDADDVGGDVLSYRFDFDNNGTYEVQQSSSSASHTYAQDGLKTVNVQVCDSANACVLGSTTLNVANLAPMITAFPTPAAVNENSAGASVALSATASDAGIDDVLTYAFDCTSDGTDDVTNTTGTATCVYAASGTYTATVHVSDDGGGTAFASTQVRVNNVAPAIATVVGLNVNEGNATTVTITASDAGGDALSYRFDFNNDGQFDVQKATGSATWTYPQDGLKTVGVEVCDNENACAQGTTTLTIANVAPVIASVSTPSSVSRGTAITAIADASDVGNDKLSYLFNFKDSNGTVLFAIGPQASNVAAATISDSGAYSVEVVVTDTAGAPNVALTATASSNFTVTDISVAVSVVANPSTISEGGSTTITVTTPGGTGPYLVRYDVNGDGDFNDAEDIIPADANDTCMTCSETITYADNRTGNLPYRVLVEVTDTGEGNAIATALVSVTVNNVAPTIAAIGDIAAAPEQTALAVAIVGTDVGANDTITYSLVSGPSAITVDANTGNLSWTPNWTDEGANSITVRATDNDGGKSEETFTVTVTIIDTNNNSVSDTRERELNNGALLPPDAGTTDSDNDGVTDLQEVLDGTDPNVSDAPSAPLILSPDKESVDTLRPTLIVVNAESPRGLELQYTFVVEDSTGTEITRISGVSEGVNTTSVEVDVDLTEDAVYTWFANADDGFVVGEDSQDGEFQVNTTNSAPPVPENLTPLDMAILPSGVLAALELRAVVDPDGDAVSYEFEIATDVMFNNLVTTSELRSVPFFTLSEVLAPGKYFWHGRATDGTDASAYGTATFFTIEASVSNVAPPAPTIVKPDGVVLATTSATLEITGVVDADGDDVEYIFEIADNAAFAGADTSGLQAELTYAVTGLTEDTTYFWRARSSDGSATSEWVSASFAVNAQNAAPTGLAIVSPAPGALLERAPEGLVWAEATDADGDTLTYTVELATTADFAEILYTEDFAAGDSVAVPTGVTFDPELTYYWRVTVSDGTDSDVVTGSFDLYSTPVVSAGTGGDDGCGCSSVAKPDARQPMALIFGLMMAGLLVMRRRKRD